MPQSAEFNFDDLTPIEYKFTLFNQKYVLVEASEDAAVKYKNASIRAAKLVDGKLASMGNIADAEPLLVSLCLYVADEQGNIRLQKDGTPNGNFLVADSTVRSWPNRVVKRLFNKIVEISELETTEESKEGMEAKFKELAGKLVGLAVNREEQQQWRRWMHECANAALEGADLSEDHAKNVQSSTPGTSA